MSFSTTLKSQLFEYMQPRSIVNLYSKDVFLRNLLIVYSIIVATENLLRIARDETLDNLKLRDYYKQHLIEEKDHVFWLTEDLKTADVNVKDFNTPKAIREMVGSVYYAIYHESSAALLGYMLLLEGNSMPLEALDRLEKRHGKKLLRTLRYHSVHDPDHAEDILKMIDSCTVKEQLLIEEIAFQSAEKLGIEFKALAA